MDREQVIKGLEFTIAMITFNPSTGEDIEPENLNEDNKITYDACVGAIALLKEQEAVDPLPQNSNGWVRTIKLWYCGACHSKISRRSSKYCPNCGKPILWERR